MNTVMNRRLIFNYNLATSFYHFSIVFLTQYSLFLSYLFFIFVTLGSFLNSFCNREYVFLFYEIKTYIIKSNNSTKR